MPSSLNQTSLTSLLPSIELDMSDDALVTFGAPVAPNALSFHDIGYMPVNAVTIAGTILESRYPAD